MTHKTTSERDRALLRLLTGEASPEEARTLHAAMEQEPELARRHARLRRTWQGLELPAPEPAPPGFAQRVTARLPDAAPAPEAGGILGLAGAPRWARAAAALALALGLGTGMFLGQGLAPDQGASGESDPVAEEIVLVETEPGLADAYRSLLYGSGEAP